MNTFFMAFYVIALASCATPQFLIRKQYKQLNVEEKVIADSLLLTGLDNEALYTLADTLKPMSSVKMYRLPLLSTNAIQKDSALQALRQLQYIANKLSNHQFQFILNPFERADSIYKNVELYVIRNKTLQKKIAQYQHFYGNLGITPNTNPATVLAITEYEQKYTRWRSYGYLFGYPDYAVDFFVEAGKSQDSTKNFVKRDFFQIPVYSGATGHFTYAIPKGYQPTTLDSSLYFTAQKTLQQYIITRKKFTTTKGTKANKLWWKTIK
jgi:hypothetical protein